MKQFTLAGVVLFSACSPVSHSFAVDAEHAASPVTAASVTICGKSATVLARSGTRFNGVVTSNCEGEGTIRLNFADGTIAECKIGYVTILDDRWHFAVRGRSCEPAEKSPA